MTNPDHYEEEVAADPALSVLSVAGKVAAGMALVMVAATAVAAYVSARAGQDARERLNGAGGDAGRAMRATERQFTGTTRAAFKAVTGPRARPDAKPAVTSES